MSWKVITKLGQTTLQIGIDMPASARTRQPDAEGAMHILPRNR